jgi:muconolactone delta-isomerase
MQFLTLSRRRTEHFTEDQFASRAPQEVAQARVLYAEGFFRQLWHRADVPGACLLVEADSESHVREKLNTLPLVQAGMLEISIIPLKPYSGFCPPATPADAAEDR